MNEKRIRGERRKYSAPELRRVELRPEESLVTGCKTAGGTLCAGGDCMLNGCMNNGS